MNKLRHIVKRILSKLNKFLSNHKVRNMKQDLPVVRKINQKFQIFPITTKLK